MIDTSNDGMGLSRFGAAPIAHHAAFKPKAKERFHPNAKCFQRAL
jgi:hypothetical protein